MGTYYRVVINCGHLVTQEVLDRALQEINSVLSAYDPQSDLSVFNQSDNVGEWVPANPILIDVLGTAQRVSTQTDGLFDVTVAPLVDLWGFGREEVDRSPNPEDIAQVLPNVSYTFLEIDENRQAIRKMRAIKLDVGGIGKGYGVDHLANLLLHQNCSDFLVNIGGDLRVLGRNAVGKPWRVGIETPDNTGQIHTFLDLNVGALATSGSYRNIRNFGQQSYSHLIDPRTGYPTSHNLVATTVYHPMAAEADALATALFIMGFEKAIAFAETQNIAVALTVWDRDSRKVRTSYSSAMEQLMDLGS